MCFEVLAIIVVVSVWWANQRAASSRYWSIRNQTRIMLIFYSEIRELSIYDWNLEANQETLLWSNFFFCENRTLSQTSQAKYIYISFSKLNCPEKISPLRPCKRTQHCWPTTPNIVGPNSVVTCCVRLHGTTTMLALVGTCCVQFETGQTFGPTSPNIFIVLWPAKHSATMSRPFTWNRNNVGQCWPRENVCARAL